MRAPAASVSAVARPTVPLAPPTRAAGVDVKFGLDRFKLGGPARAIPVSQATAAAPMAGLSRTVGMAQLRPITAPTSAMPTLRAPAQFAASVSALKPAPVSMTRMPPAAGLTAMRAPAASVSAVARPTVPLAPPTRAAGVDVKFGLDRFKLGGPARAIPVSQATAAAPMAGLSRTVGMAQLRPITAPTSAMPTL